MINERMSNEEKVDKIFQVLTSAYMDNTLQPGSACGCATGNIIAYALNTKVRRKIINGIPSDYLHWENDSPSWGHLFYTLQKNTLAYEAAKVNKLVQENDTHAQFIRTSLIDRLEEYINHEVKSTGLPLEVLMGIEFTFESNAYTGNSRDDQMYKGLSAVLEYLSTYFGISQSKKQASIIALEEVFA